MRLFEILRKIHLTIYAWFLSRYRIRETVKVFKVAHAAELHAAHPGNWPQLQARHEQELAAIKAGRLDAAQDVSRKSWQWPFLPASVNRLATPIIKATPYNLRRMSRTPIPRRAINLIKNAVTAMQWDVTPIDDVEPLDDDDEQKERCKIAKSLFQHPNMQDSFQTFIEQSIEDLSCFGAFATELAYTPDPLRPLKMWPVNIESVRIFASWTEDLSDDMPHYAQMTGLKGERGAVLFYDDELLYVKDNCSTDSPFGLGKMEVAFQSINDFLGIQYMSGRAGTDQIHKTWLWWEQPQTDAHYQIVRRHIQNELEGQAKISIIGGVRKPEVIEVNPTTEDDLLLNWQELLIRVIALAFDLSALSFIEHDINRAVGQVLDDRDFRSAVVPVAKRIMEAFTRRVLHSKLGWKDIRFAFLNMDDPDKSTMNEMCARMYSGNAMTPNGWRKKMGEEPLDTPFADLTQFECMLLNMEAMSELQSQQADQQAQRQQQMMQQQQMMMPPGTEEDDETQPDTDQPKQFPAPPDGGNTPPGKGKKGVPPGKGQPQGGPPQQQKGLVPMTPGNMAKGGQPPSPKPLALPKFPISGSRYTAKQIARMPVNHLADMIYTSQLPQPSQLLNDMKSQEPNILDQMTEEVREFFEQAIELEQQEKAKMRPLSKKVTNDWKKKQMQRFNKQSKRMSDFTEWLWKKGQHQGRPGGGSAKGGIIDLGDRRGVMRKPGGRPGNINPGTKY